MATAWWQNGTIYQIYPKSFQDTTGSGTGDLRGIIQRLDYLAELGIAAIWLTPITVSPQIDNGYDVADYRDIDPSYGTMADFEELISEAHTRGIRIVMDMVFNHSSTLHRWFVEGEDPASPYHDYYLWQDGTPGNPPNQWQSKFGGNAWKWSDKAGQYYLHLFAPEQADLNWENPKLREEVADICRFWAEKGVDGLRLDVVNLISKTPGFPNDPEGDGRRYYTDGPRIHEFLRELSARAFQPNQLMTVGEMSSTTLENCQQYANLDASELSMTFNFHHLKVDYPNGEKWSLADPDFAELKSIFNYWQQGMHGKAWNAIFWCNHDQPRVVTRFGDDQNWRVRSAKLWGMLLHGMQGTPYVYQGEELGMTNPHFTSLEQYRDVETLNMHKELRQQGKTDDELLPIFAQKSRDNSRTPMQWSNETHAGFTQGEPWIEVAANYPEVNAQAALADPDSVFQCYKRLIALRKELPVFTDGDYADLLPESDDVWVYQRASNGSRLLVTGNLGNECAEIPLPEGQWRVLLNNGEDIEPAARITLAPYQCVYWLEG